MYLKISSRGKMENIRLLLIKISDRLFKAYSLFGDKKSVIQLDEKINNASKEELFRIATYMLDYAITNNRYHTCKEYFNELLQEAIDMISDDITYNDYFTSNIYLYFKQLNYPVYLDGVMNPKDNNKGVFSNKIRVIIPEELSDKVLRDMYGKGASIYENGDPAAKSDNIIFTDFDALLYFSNGFEMDISYYSVDSKNNLVTKKYQIDDEGNSVVSYNTFNEIKQSLCFNKIPNSNLYIDTLEFEYVRACKNGTNYDFIRLMSIKDKVNRKKVAAIRSYDNIELLKKENKNYGL